MIKKAIDLRGLGNVSIMYGVRSQRWTLARPFSTKVLIQEKSKRKVERIQGAVTKMILTLKDQTYEAKMERLGLLSLEERRERGDLIAIYKVMKEMEKKLTRMTYLYGTQGRQKVTTTN